MFPMALALSDYEESAQLARAGAGSGPWPPGGSSKHCFLASRPAVCHGGPGSWLNTAAPQETM